MEGQRTKTFRNLRLVHVGVNSPTVVTLTPSVARGRVSTTVAEIPPPLCVRGRNSTPLAYLGLAALALPLGVKIMELSQVLSWIGFVTGMSIGIPQLVKTLKTKSVSDLSATTFVLILITCSCLLVRAIAIQELAFVCYYSLLIFINSLQLFLIWKYKDRKIVACR